MRKSFAPCLLALAMTSCGLLASGCGVVPGDEDDEVTSADESVSSSEALTKNVAVGSKLRTTTGLNLRAGSSTSAKVLLAMPSGSIVTVRQSAPVNGFYAVTYGNTNGWAHGNYLVEAGSGGGAAPATGGNKTVKILGPKVRAHVQAFANAACSQIGCPYELGTRAGHDPSADRAVDMMMAKYGTKPKDGGAHGTKIANFALKNDAKYKVMYVIWYQRINSNDGRGWRMMADRGSITQNHYDHVHVSFDP
jgi:uncharacterized protein YraI